jgi:hypothetical protein
MIEFSLISPSERLFHKTSIQISPIILNGKAQKLALFFLDIFEEAS